MKVIMKAPRWPNYHGLLCHIRNMVLDEGGDGWAWIVTEDPKKMVDDFIKVFEYCPSSVSENQDMLTVIDNQESWVFSKTEPLSNYDYDFLFIIED